MSVKPHVNVDKASLCNTPGQTWVKGSPRVLPRDEELTTEPVREAHEGGDERMVGGGLVVELLQGVQHVRIIPRARLRAKTATAGAERF